MIEIYVIQVSSVLNESLAAEERDLQESIEFYKKRENLTKFSEETHVNITSLSTILLSLHCIGCFHSENIFLQSEIARFYSTNARTLAALSQNAQEYSPSFQIQRTVFTYQRNRKY